MDEEQHVKTYARLSICLTYSFIELGFLFDTDDTLVSYCKGDTAGTFDCTHSIEQKGTNDLGLVPMESPTFRFTVTVLFHNKSMFPGEHRRMRSLDSESVTIFFFNKNA